VVHRGHKEFRASKVFKECRDYRGYRDLLVRKAPEEYKAPKEYKVFRVCKDYKDYRDLQVRKVYKAIRVFKVSLYKAQKDKLEVKDFRVSKVLRVFRDCKVFKDYRAYRAIKVSKELRACKAYKVFKGLLCKALKVYWV
jgi:hypothetical protein